MEAALQPEERTDLGSTKILETWVGIQETGQ